MKELILFICNLKTLLIFFGILSFSVFQSSAQTSGCLSGAIFEDFNCDGIKDAKEPAFEGLEIAIYDAQNNLVTTTTSLANGNWAVCGLTDTHKFRVEFLLSSAQDFWANPSHVGTDNSSDVRFVAAPADDLNFSLSSPEDFCVNNPELMVTCFTQGAYNDPNTAHEFSVIGVSYSDGMDVDGNVNGTTFGNPDPFSGGPVYDPAPPPGDGIAAFSEVGTVYGIAKSETTDKIFLSSYIKAGSSLGPGESTGMIYQTCNLSGAPVTSSYVDLNAVLGANTFGPNPHPVATSSYEYPDDTQTNAEIGKIGIGDIELSLDESELYVVNLFDRKLYSVPTSGPVNAGAVQSFTIPNMGLPTITNAAGDPGTCAPSDVRPFGLGMDDFGNLYVGAVCSAESISAGVNVNPNDASYQLTAYVWKFDGTNFTLVLDESLRFNRDPTSNNTTYNTYDSGMDGAFPYNTDWEPWHDLSTESYFFGQPDQNEPILADIEFDTNGDMILGMRDRSGDIQTINGGYSSSGDIYKACLSGPCAWQFESDASCGGNTTAGAGNDQGPDGGEFYYQDDQGDGIPNSGTGGLVVIPCSDQVVSGATDPVYLDSNGNKIFAPNAAGIQIHNNTTGEIEGAYNLFEADNDNSVIKASGIGDLEACCGVPPLEIGNYVWCDTIQNGIQDACEEAIDGLIVQLYDANGVLVGQDVTANGGQYYFNETNVDTTGISGGAPLTGWTGLNYDSKYYLAYGDGQFNSNQFVLNGESYTVSPNTDVNGNANDNVDSDVSATALSPGGVGSLPAGLPFLCINSDKVGCGNHRYDLGLNCCPVSQCFEITVIRN